MKHRLILLCVLSLTLLPSCGRLKKHSLPEMYMTLDQDVASAFAQLALKGIQREYPNKLDHVMNSAAEVMNPKILHPAFYGSFD